jgi:hypothetical protein
MPLSVKTPIAVRHDAATGVSIWPDIAGSVRAVLTLEWSSRAVTRESYTANGGGPQHSAGCLCLCHLMSQ